MMIAASVFLLFFLAGIVNQDGTVRSLAAVHGSASDTSSTLDLTHG